MSEEYVHFSYMQFSMQTKEWNRTLSKRADCLLQWDMCKFISSDMHSLLKQANTKHCYSQ